MIKPILYLTLAVQISNPCKYVCEVYLTSNPRPSYLVLPPCSIGVWRDPIRQLQCSMPKIVMANICVLLPWTINVGVAVIHMVWNTWWCHHCCDINKIVKNKKLIITNNNNYAAKWPVTTHLTIHAGELIRLYYKVDKYSLHAGNSNWTIWKTESYYQIYWSHN